jgi:hypothetical protein
MQKWRLLDRFMEYFRGRSEGLVDWSGLWRMMEQRGVKDDMYLPT